MKRLTLGFLLAILLLFPGIRAVSALQDHPTPTRQYVVKAGDTLWSIAFEVDPDPDRRAVVDDLMQLNDLSSAQLLPGQTLSLPI